MIEEYIGKISRKEREKFAGLGFLCQTKLNSGASISSSDVIAYCNAVQSGTIAVDIDYGAQFPAVAVWAEVCEESAKKYIDNGLLPRFGYEYREGNLIIAIDVICPYGSVCKLIALLRPLVQKGPIIYRRKGRLRLVLIRNRKPVFRSVKLNEEGASEAARNILNIAINRSLSRD